MQYQILKPIIGICAILLYTLNILFWPFIIFGVAALRIIPNTAWQRVCNKFLHKIPVYWSDINSWILKTTTDIKWDVRGLDQLQKDDWYLLICNHQTWADILVLEYVFNRKIPTLKFFMKKELLWSLPFAGWAAKLIGFPIMYRHQKGYLAKHPDQKGKDIETTRKACEKFKNIPTTVISFVEGTRFTFEKKQLQTSPYQYLLRPKAGGIAFALAAMGSYFNKILNVVIIYDVEKPSFWDLCCGRIQTITVHINLLPIVPELLDDYENKRETRVYFQNWLNNLWHKNDEIINELRTTR